MKQRIFLAGTGLICLVFSFCLFAASAYATAPTLSLETTTNGATQSASFQRGQDIYLNIVSNNSTDIAGCAFTVEYDANVVDPPITDADGLSTNITSPFFTTFTDSRIQPGTPPNAIPMRSNAITGTARIALSGANINTTTGGAKVNAGGGVLFTLKFKVKSSATLGNYNFKLLQTSLNNTAAGYSAAGEAIPLLVGAVPNTDTTNWSNLSAAFPVLLGDSQNPFTTVTQTYAVITVPEYALSGTVSYSGYQSGTLKVGAFSDAALTQRVTGQDIAWPQGTTNKTFSISLANGAYYIGAYIDANGNQSVNADEANGKNAAAIVISGAPDTSTRITLTDPLSGGTGSEPLYYVNWKNTSGKTWGSIGTMTADADMDGYSNIQEYVNQKAGLTGFDPTVKDAPGGQGYNSITDENAPWGVRTHSSGYVPGGNFEVTIRITYSGTLSALSVRDTIPAEWTYVSVSGTNVPTLSVPSPNAIGTLEFAWAQIPASPVEFKYTVKAPGTVDGTKTFSGQVLYRRLAGEQMAPMTDTTVQKKAYHSADYNTANWKINLSELLRVVQFFNLGGYHCDPQGEDGYAPGLTGDQTCAPHNSDYNTQNWKISLTELLRLVQFFNLGGYHADPAGEDGFAPGL